MSTVHEPIVEYQLLHDVSWQEYEEFLQANQDRHIRHTYDRGRLEIMTLSYLHENAGGFLGRLINTYTEELNIPLRTGGSTTCRKEDLDTGLEPDNFWWIQNESAMLGKRGYDADIDPPPDLAHEIDVSRSCLDRMSVYAALKVPEIWRYADEDLQFYVLGRDGKYRISQRSRAFPDLPREVIVRFLLESLDRDETALIREFRQWVRANILPLFEETKSKEGLPGKPPSRRKKSAK